MMVAMSDEEHDSELLREQEHKGYGFDEGERDDAFDAIDEEESDEEQEDE
jgi:hypothetical protein